MRDGQRPRLFGFFLAVLLLGLITLAIAEIGTGFLIVMVIIVCVAVGGFYLLFPGSNLFAISLADFLGVYTCIFVFFVITNFGKAETWAVELGYTFPIVAFFGGAILRRKSLQYIVQAHRVRDERHLGRTFIWLIPVFGIGALTFLVPSRFQDPETVSLVFLASMGAIGIVVLFASRDITTFLIDSGLLFEEFFHNISRLLVPSFAFFTFYSLFVIVFGCIYRIVDRFSETPHFLVGDVPAELDFSQALYFSIVTFSTVGYGDITPLSDSVRVIVSIQIIIGVLLLLFGFSEIISYARTRREER